MAQAFIKGVKLMAKWKKIRDKLRIKSSDITFDDALTLLSHYGYSMSNKGKTSGSRVRFSCSGRKDFLLHKPHPQKELKGYVIDALYDLFTEEDMWDE